MELVGLCLLGKAWGGSNMTGTTPSKRRTLAIAASAALAAGTLGAVAAVPASGTQTGNGVRPGSNITVFHNIDFVAVFGYGRPVNRPVTVRVLRRGVVIGSASGPSIDAEGLPGLEVNHGPEGAARPGRLLGGLHPRHQARRRDPGDRRARHRPGDGRQHRVHRSIRSRRPPPATSSSRSPRCCANGNAGPARANRLRGVPRGQPRSASRPPTSSWSPTARERRVRTRCATPLRSRRRATATC